MRFTQYRGGIWCLDHSIGPNKSILTMLAVWLPLSPQRWPIPEEVTEKRLLHMAKSGSVYSHTFQLMLNTCRALAYQSLLPQEFPEFKRPRGR